MYTVNNLGAGIAHCIRQTIQGTERWLAEGVRIAGVADGRLITWLITGREIWSG